MFGNELEEAFPLAHSFGDTISMVGKAWQQDLEAAGPVVSAVMKQREMKAVARLSFSFAYRPRSHHRVTRGTGIQGPGMSKGTGRLGRNFGKPNETTMAEWEIGGCMDQGLEWAGLGPGVLSLVIGDAAESSTVECIVWFVLLEGFPWAQHCPFTWQTPMLFVPGFCPASPGLQGHGMRAVSSEPVEELPGTTSKYGKLPSFPGGTWEQWPSVESGWYLLPRSSRAYQSQKADWETLLQVAGSLSTLSPAPARAALGLIKRRLLVRQLSVQRVIPPVIPDR